MKLTILLAVAGAIATATAAFAAAPAPATITMNDDHTLYHVQASPGSFTPAIAHRRDVLTVFENFANHYPLGLYNASTGAAVSGPNTIHGQIWLASAFTPAGSAVVTEVAIAAAFINGPKNAVELHIYADAAGVPGAELWAHKITLPPFGNCCAVVDVKGIKGVKVTAGTQYWVALTTLGNSGEQVSAAWNQNVFDQVHPGVSAQNRGTGWQPGSSLPQLAFGVYSK